ncbi:YdgH/BhsA/McbA-like domain containing protein [Acerihabitans sp. TG2]|uniref:multiple stress resistance protein BhsA n=1 Tax=Acerihabitans sp. TG2 TaxID=3096008 RepID=UPI002B22A11A|nr:YdgH/BhsA/McbA-like domain containing protein [Acerihabitans sp. TG2]MEA9391341.1 YdgH/BhsA/McbA-like domain containing protein [Acerihabitans sp. TG2]
MKNLHLAVAAIVLSTVSFAGFAAQEVNSRPAGEHRIGVVSSATTSTLDDLQSQLAAKADATGATSYRIIGVSGNDTLHGSAELYK